jgi:SAM-dependent methyltransferase
MQSDVIFAGSIPASYDHYLGPLLFIPYAEDLAGRAAALGTKDILETAAGTGLVSAALQRKIPDARLTVTDLNRAMLDVAAGRIAEGGAVLCPADAQSLPFPDASFDLVICQFGMMFLPDRSAGYREAARVLRPGGSFLFNVWNSLAENPIPRIITAALAKLFPENPPNFLARGPHGYSDVGVIKTELEAAGFVNADIDTLVLRSRAPFARDAALGFCEGSPLRTEIETHHPGMLEAAADAAENALKEAFGTGPIDVPMSAHVVCAKRP